MSDIPPQNYVIVVFLTCCSALFSGLTLGLMGLDMTDLEVVMKGGTAQDAAYAAKIAPVRAEGNMLLCTLLLGNVAVNAGLSIVMADMTSGLVGFLVSTITIVIFGEIMPQAYCSRNPLAVGAATIPIVKVVKFILYIFVKPMSIALDYILGAEMANRYTKGELAKLLDLHKGANDIEMREVDIMKGALDFGNREVSQIMTPIDQVFMLEAHQKLDFDVLTEIFKSGYSRIPVYDKTTPFNTIIGLLFVKDLILIDPSDETPIGSILEFYKHEMNTVFPDEKLSALLDVFKTGRSHLAVVQDVYNDGPGDPYPKNVGIVSLEDILETILQDQISDETDVNAQTKKFDTKSLRIFDRRRKPFPGRIAPQEISTIYYHLTGEVELFQGQHRKLSEAAIKRLIGQAKIEHIVMDEKDEENKESEDRLWLYKRGEPTEYFSLILEGEVEVFAGRGKFRSTLRRWSSLCVDILEDCPLGDRNPDRVTNHEPFPEFCPDFSARVLTTARVMRISRESYYRAYHGVEPAPDSRQLRASSRDQHLLTPLSTAASNPATPSGLHLGASEDSGAKGTIISREASGRVLSREPSGRVRIVSPGPGANRNTTSSLMGDTPVALNEVKVDARPDGEALLEGPDM